MIEAGGLVRDGPWEGMEIGGGVLSAFPSTRDAGASWDPIPMGLP